MSEIIHLLRQINDKLAVLCAVALAFHEQRMRPDPRSPTMKEIESGGLRYVRFSLQDGGWLRATLDERAEPVSCAIETRDGDIEVISVDQARSRFPDLPIFG